MKRIRTDAGESSDVRVVVQGFTEERGEAGERGALLALLMVVLALLLVVCANVSNLLLVRSVDRSKTLAVHAALGAGPGQVVLQLLTEAFLIALVGAVGGLAIAYGSVRFIETTLAGHWGYYWMSVRLRPEVLVFLLALALVTALVSGALPALRVGRADLVQPLKQGRSEAPKGTGWIGWAFLTGQVAFSFVALIVSVLMTAGLFKTRAVSGSFPAESIHVASLSLAGESYPDEESRADFRSSLLGALGETESVGAVGLSDGLPGLNAPMGILEMDGVALDENGRAPRMLMFGVTPGFFDVFDVDVVQGRGIRDGDTSDSEQIVVVSAGFVARHLGSGNLVGQRIHVRRMDGEAWWTVVGVVSDVVIYDESINPRAEWIYVPLDQVASSQTYVTFRSTLPGSRAQADIKAAVRAIDPDLPLALAMGGNSTVAEVLAYVRRIFQTVGALSGLGGLASVLVAAVGLFGLLSFDVRRRLPELGVRLALGAGASRVVRGVMQDGLVCIAPGLLVGLVIAYLITPYFALFLSGVDARDPWVFAGVVSGYVLIAMVATLPPAVRAASVNPARVLASE